MTVETQTRKIIHTGNAVTTIWDYPFKINSADDLELYLFDIATATLGAQISSGLYDVAGVGDATGGTVTYPLSGSPVPATEKLVIRRVVPYIQDQVIFNEGGFHPAVVELGLDDLEMQIQQLTDKAEMPVVPSGGAVAIISADGLGIDNGPTLAALAAASAGTAVVFVVTGRTALKALDTTVYSTAMLSEGGRSGLFVWRTGDYSAEVTLDTTEAIYLAGDGIATTVGAWVREFSGPVDIKWFGALGDGTTDDLAAFNAAEALGISPVKLTGGGFGDYLMSVPPTPSDIYWQVEEGATWTITAGAWNPRHYSQIGGGGSVTDSRTEPYERKVNFIADNPSIPNGDYAIIAEAFQKEEYLINAFGYQELDGAGNLSGSLYTSVNTALRERTNNVTTLTTGTNHLLRTGNVVNVTSMTDASFIVFGVTVTVTGATTFTYANVGPDVVSGADVGGVVSGQFTRTMSAQHRWRLAHTGEGDCYGLYATAQGTDHGNPATKTGWGGQPSTGLLGCEITAATDTVNLYGMGDIVLDDLGRDDVAMLGQVVFIEHKGTDTAAYEVPRFGLYIKSTGTSDIDAQIIIGGLSEVGIDISSATPSTGAAITLREGQGIYFDAVPSATSGKFNTQAVGNYFIEKDAALSYIKIEANSVETKVWEDRLELPGHVSPGGTTVKWTSGSGTPEGAVTAPIGSLFTRTDGGASTTLYVKESGVGNTGWVAK